MNKHHGKQLQRTFVTGLIVLAPLAATAFILKSLYDYVGSISPFGFFGNAFLSTLATGVAVVLIILLVGWLSRTALGSVLELADDGIAKLPGVGLIYSALRDLVNAVSGEERRFRHPVWVRPVPASPLKLIGFITRDDLSQLGVKGEVAVYLPDSYNISGKLVVVPKRLVTPIKSRSRDLFAFVATGGLTGAHSGGRDARD